MQRRALGFLFGVVAAALVVTAASAFAGAGGARGWIIGFAALALAVWLGSLALSAFRR